MIDFKAFLLSPKGRIGRKEFFIFMIPYMIVLSSILYISDDDSLAYSIFIVLTTWSCIVVHIKRFHDFGQSAWISILGYPLILSIIMSILMFSSLEFMFSGLDGILEDDFGSSVFDWVFVYAPVVIVLSVMLALCTIPGWIPGDKGENKYGPTPYIILKDFDEKTI